MTVQSDRQNDRPKMTVENDRQNDLRVTNDYDW